MSNATKASIKTVKAFQSKARKSGRSNDVAWAQGCLDALRGKPASGDSRDYLQGWLKVEGI